jgi:hypothetical protein
MSAIRTTPLPGEIVQRQYAEIRTAPSTTLTVTAYPPVSTDGASLFSVSFTPKFSDSTVRVTVYAFTDAFTTHPSARSSTTLMVFCSTTFVTASYPCQYSDGQVYPCAFRAEYAPGAGAKTWQLRFSATNQVGYTNTSYINGNGWGTQFGIVTSMTLEEIKV